MKEPQKKISLAGKRTPNIKRVCEQHLNGNGE
jgi:hypothetical protein